MNLKNERKEAIYKYDVDMTNEELDQLAEVGLKRIKKDKEALVNYAVVKILEDYIMRMEGLREGNKLNGNKDYSKRKDLDRSKR